MSHNQLLQVTDRDWTCKPIELSKSCRLHPLSSHGPETIWCRCFERAVGIKQALNSCNHPISEPPPSSSTHHIHPNLSNQIQTQCSSPPLSSPLPAAFPSLLRRPTLPFAAAGPPSAASLTLWTWPPSLARTVCDSVMFSRNKAANHFHSQRLAPDP